MYLCVVMPGNIVRQLESFNIYKLCLPTACHTCVAYVERYVIVMDLTFSPNRDARLLKENAIIQKQKDKDMSEHLKSLEQQQRDARDFVANKSVS